MNASDIAMALALADVAADDAYKAWATYARSTTPTEMWATPEGWALFNAHVAAFDARAAALVEFRSAQSTDQASRLAIQRPAPERERADANGREAGAGPG